MSAPFPALGIPAIDGRQHVDGFDAVIDFALVPAATRVGIVADTIGYTRIYGLARSLAGLPGTLVVRQGRSTLLLPFTQSFPTAPDPVSGDEVAAFEVPVVSQFVRVDYVNGGVGATLLDLNTFLRGRV